MKVILIIPFVFFIISVGFYIFWSLTTLYCHLKLIILIVGNRYILGLTPQEKGKIGAFPFSHSEWTTQIKWFFGYYVFALIWNHAFLLALSQFIIACATVIWYFEDVRRNEKNPVT